MKKKQVKVFSSFEEENKAEEARRAKLTLSQRLSEFSVIQQRAWGKNWKLKRISKQVSFETFSW